jgi:hypothetical protein
MATIFYRTVLFPPPLYKNVIFAQSLHNQAEHLMRCLAMIYRMQKYGTVCASQVKQSAGLARGVDLMVFAEGRGQ